MWVSRHDSSVLLRRVFRIDCGTVRMYSHPVVNNGKVRYDSSVSEHELCTQCTAVYQPPNPMYFNHITRPTSLPTYIPPLYHTHPIRRTSWPSTTPLPRMPHAPCTCAHTTSDTIPLTHTPYVILPAELCSADMRRARVEGERVQGVRVRAD
jgi:hypothetical protein